MYKSAIILTLIFGLSLIEAAPVNESSEVRRSMHDAFQNSLGVFGGRVEKNVASVRDEPNPSKPKVFSLYTKGLNALGGGKPHLTSQYIQHKYVPLAPVVVPEEKKPQVSDKLSAEEAAERFKPQAPYQYTTDRLFQ